MRMPLCSRSGGHESQGHRVKFSRWRDAIKELAGARILACGGRARLRSFSRRSP